MLSKVLIGISMTLVAAAFLLAALPAHGGTDSLEGLLSGRPQITCRSHAFVRGEEVTLGAIANVATLDPEEEQSLSSLTLAPSPHLGQSRPLHRNLIIARLAQAGWDLEALDARIPETVTVEREALRLSERDLEQVVRDLLPEALPHDPSRVVIDQIRVPGEVILAPGVVDWELRLTGTRRTLGSVGFELLAHQGEEQPTRIQGNARVDVEVELIEVLRDMPRGVLISSEHIRPTPGMMRSAPRGAITSPGLAVGMMTTQQIRAGDILTERALERPRLVRRGDVVTMIFESGGLRLTDRATATEDGAAGDEITVNNIESGRSVRALVTGERTVRVLR
ncbi:flagellar basal body P-ring formation protein FlgA [Candidatus Sumerlaeota bacterium]|nr:flagellar basal body P-ring formation protein FlgA [Candidatus Sumerlaeota bacterium]